MIARPIPLFNAYRNEEIIMAAAIGIPRMKNAMKLTKNSAMLDILPRLLSALNHVLRVGDHVADNVVTHQPKADRKHRIHIF